MDRREQETLDKLREKAADTEIPETLKPEQIRRMLDEKEPGTEDVVRQLCRWRCGRCRECKEICLIRGMRGRLTGRIKTAAEAKRSSARKIILRSMIVSKHIRNL